MARDVRQDMPLTERPSNTAPPAQAALRGLERGLFGLAALLLVAYALARADSAIYGALQDQRLERALREGSTAGPSRRLPAATPSSTADAPAAAARRPPPRPAERSDGGDAFALSEGVIGRLEAPRLGLRAIVAEGLDERTLLRAAGHVPGTALPGHAGNVAIAGHRDTAFRRLAGVRHGDRLRLVTAGGTYEYTVESLLVVERDRVDLLEPTPEPTLTLVTCYPFRMIGPAPQRLVVRARQVSPPTG